MRSLYFRLLLCAGALLFHLSAGAQQVPAFQWAQVIPELASTPVFGPDGDIYALTQTGLIRYTTGGVVRRITPCRSSDPLNSFRIQFDSLGHVYAAGIFGDTLEVGTHRLIAPPGKPRIRNMQMG